MSEVWADVEIKGKQGTTDTMTGGGMAAARPETGIAEGEQGEDHATLDPMDWESFRTQGHRMLDDILDYTKKLRQRPVWQPAPDEVRQQFRSAVPRAPSDVAEVHAEFMKYVLPYGGGNTHPGFMGWVQGGGTPVGMLAEMLAAGLNANVGGRNQIPIEVEQQIVRWMQQIFGFPQEATGLFVTGTSMANFMAVVVARDTALGSEARTQGVAGRAKRLTAYASAAVHGCVGKAMDLCGIGSDALRLVPVDDRRRISIAAVATAIQKDREAGLSPFLIVGTAGTVDTGAVDDLASLAELAKREQLWFHVDGALGALGILSVDVAPKLAGIDCADSLAFDFHKWGQVPYDAGFLLVRDSKVHRDAFGISADYLRRETRGLGAGSFWPCDFGPDLSRGFRALKVWFTLKAFGTAAVGAAISRSCALARYLEQRVSGTPELELLAPVELNIVCFRYGFRCAAEEANRLNTQIVIELQESGSVAPSTTMIDGQLAIRAAIVNHRTTQSDIDRLIDETLRLGGQMAQEKEAVGRAANAAAGARVSAPRGKWEAELPEVESKIAANPDSVELHFRRACLLAELGRLIEARNEYVHVLQREPFHLAAMNNLGTVLIALGHRQAARMAFHEAATRHPESVTSRVNYGSFLLDESERLTTHGQDEPALQHKIQAREQFEHALRVEPDCGKAHEGLSYLLADLGEAAQGEWHRREAFRKRYIIPLPYRGAKDPVSLLLLGSTLGGNVRMQRFLDDRIFQTFIIVPEFFDLRTPLPAHHVVINGIGDVEISRGALEATPAVLAMTRAPVVNPPAAVLATSRSNNAKRFGALPGVVTPRTIMLRRKQLANSGAASKLERRGFEFPLLLRAPGFHTGQHFVKVDDLAGLPAALAGLPGNQIIVMQYLDARGPDGKTRKYRVMLIDGQIYPLHLAISSQWKVHYFTAEMNESEEHRAEDAAFLENMPEVLGTRALNALQDIQRVLGLDYAGIDFSLNEKGEVLLFEANATMAVNPPGAEERWKYRLPAYKQIREAVQNMLLKRAGRAA